MQALLYREKTPVTDELKTEEIKKLLKDVINLMGDKKELTLTGGEPFLREDIMEILEYADFLGFKKIFIITNGTLLNDKIAAKLGRFNEQFIKHATKEEVKYFGIQVSIDGFKDTHERVWVWG